MNNLKPKSIVLVFALSVLLNLFGCTDETVKSEKTNTVHFTNSISSEIIEHDDPVFENIIKHLDSSENIIGYTVEMTVKSRSGPFSIRIRFDENTQIIAADVMAYRARRGREVKSSKFTSQFIGKKPSDTLKIGQDIDAVSGATLSSKIMSNGIKKALEFISSLNQS